MNKIDNRRVLGKVGFLNSPDPFAAVAQEDLARGAIKVPRVRLGRHHRSQRIAVADRGDAGSH